jgi:hypothetical protein
MAYRCALPRGALIEQNYPSGERGKIARFGDQRVPWELEFGVVSWGPGGGRGSEGKRCSNAKLL